MTLITVALAWHCALGEGNESNAPVTFGVQYWRVWQYDYVTSPGETRSLALSDGSNVTLSGDTAIKVAFNGDARDIQLARGEALFNVHHDKSRPFIVHTNSGAVRDIGTIFDVALVGDQTKVVVTKGMVEASVGERRVLISANQGMDFTAQGLGPSAGPGHDDAPGSLCSRGRAVPVRRSPHGERHNMAPAGRYSMKAII